MSSLVGLAAVAIGLVALIVINLIWSDSWLLVFFILAYPGVLASRAFYREFHIHWKRLVRASR